jgi:site-specific recombinase XerD
VGQVMEKGIPREKVFREFLIEEKARGRTEQSLSGVRSRVPLFFHYLEEERKGNILTVGIREAAGYQGWLLERKTQEGKIYSVRTVNSYFTAAGSFYEYLKRKSLVPGNPFRSVRQARADKTLPRDLLSEEETDRLLTALFTWEDTRDIRIPLRNYKVHLMAELMYSTGLRIAELAALKPEDIDLNASLVRVWEGKGRKDRICYLNEYAREILRIYLEEMRPLLSAGWNEGKETLFFSSRDRLGSVANGVFKDTCKKETLSVQTCHGFRHLMGYHLLRSGCPLRFIQQFLGHSRLHTTEIYTKVDQEELKNVIDHCHPRQKKTES